MIKYDKLFNLLSVNGYSATKIRQTGIIGQATYYGLKSGEKGLDTKTINKLCSIFNCQPNDIMEYVPDEQASEQLNASTERESIPRLLFDLRTQSGFTQTQVAKELGIDYPSYISYENGTENAPLNLLLKACKLYNVPQSYFGINNNLSAVGNKDYYVNQTDDSESISVNADEFIAVKQFLDIYRKKGRE